MKTPLLALVLPVSLLLAACSRSEPPPEPVRSVKLLEVGTGPLGLKQEYAGEVRARVESVLGFRVGGKIVQRPAEVGQRVKPGQLLALLDASDLSLASQAAQAQVSAAQTQRDLAAANLKRYQELKSQGFISGAELEKHEASLKSAEATLRQARAQAEVQGNQAAYARLQADADGVVVATDADVGQVVEAGTPVVRLARDGARDVVFSVAEDRLGQVRPGLTARVRLWAGEAAGAPAADIQGTVREVAASADPATRTYRVKLSLPAQIPVALGATAYVTLAAGDTAAPEVIKLPTSALMRTEQKGQKGTSVWVFDAASSTVQPRAVTLAGADGNDVIVADGLKPGDLVVAAGVHVLAPGQKVTRFAGSAIQ